MSDAWGYEEDEQGQPDNDYQGPKPLRDAYNKMKQKNADLEARLDAIEKQSKQNEVRTVFQTLGVDPGIAANYTGENTPEAISSWVDNMRTAFGGTATSATPTPPPEPTLSQDTQSQYQRMNEAGQSGAPLTNAEAVMASIRDAQSVNDIISAWKNIH